MIDSLVLIASVAGGAGLGWLFGIDQARKTKRALITIAALLLVPITEFSVTFINQRSQLSTIERATLRHLDNDSAITR